GRFTPAATTFTRISPGPGVGTGRSSGTNISGPPGARMAIAVMREGRFISSSMVGCPVLVAPPGCDNRTPRRYFLFGTGGRAMPAIDDDDRPKKKMAHEVGQDLTLLSVGELTERIAM